MAKVKSIDKLVRTELGRTSSFQPQRFYDILRNADPGLLREVLPTAVPGTLFFLCKQAVDLPDSERKIEIALVLADGLNNEQTAGVEQVVRSLSPNYRQRFILRALEKGNLQSWEVALNLAVRNNTRQLIPSIIAAWPTSDSDQRILISNSLFALGGHRTIKFLNRQLSNELDPAVILAMLTTSLKYKHAWAFRKNYAKYSKHDDPKIRFCGIQGLAERLTWWTHKRLMHQISQEGNLRNFDLLGRVLLSRPSPNLAQLLFNLANKHPNRKFRDSATRHFRRLPESVLLPFCMNLLSHRDLFYVALAVREMSLFYAPGVQGKLLQIISTKSYPLYVRIAATEGLTYHKTAESINLLFKIQHERDCPQTLRHAATSTLIKLCDETHMDRIIPMLELSDSDYALTIQSVLNFLQRKLRAKKITLPPVAIDRLCTIVFEGTNHNCRYLALNTLLICHPNLSLEPFLGLTAAKLTPYLKEMLTAFLATRIQVDTHLFLHWIMEDERTPKEVHTGLDSLLKTRSQPAADPMLFVNLLSWPAGHENDDYRPKIVACLHHLLRSADTSRQIAENLPTEREVFEGLLAYANELPTKDLQSFAHDRIIEWVSENPTADRTLELIPVIARFKSVASHTCLIKLFRWSDNLREHISTSLHNAIGKV